MDVIFKEGMLYLLGVKFGKKTWKKTWMVLFQPSNSGVGRLEMYDLNSDASAVVASHQAMSAAQQKRAERKVVRLLDCTSVTPAPEEACPRGCTALYLSTTLRTYTLASEACQDWFTALCQVAFQDPRGPDKRTRGGGRGGGGGGGAGGGGRLPMEDNALYSSWTEDVTLAPGQYQVMVQSTEASRRCQLSGQYVLGTDQNAAMLLDPLTGHVLYHWPYRFLRRFGPVKGGFSFEAGHRCDSGEGLFTFQSPSAAQIHQAITNHCKLVKDRKASVPDTTRSTSVLPPNKSSNNGRPDPPPARPDEPVTCYYSTIEQIGPLPVLDRRTSSLPNLQRPPNFTAPVCEWEADPGYDDEDRCDSMSSVNSLNLDSIEEDGVYYNLRASPVPQATPTTPQQEEDPPATLYSVVTYPDGGDPQQQQAPPPSSSSRPGPVKPQRRRYQQQHHQHQDQDHHHQDQDHAVQQQQTQDHTKETKEEEEEEVVRSPCREISVSFKQKLSHIISKDLAKLQPPPPPPPPPLTRGGGGGGGGGGMLPRY